MVDSSRVVSGASLDVRLLISGIVASIIATWWAMLVRAYNSAMEWARRLMFRPINAIWSLLEQLLLIPGNSLQAANQAAAEFMLALSGIGPWAWPLGMMFALGTVWATQRIVEIAEVV